MLIRSHTYLSQDNVGLGGWNSKSQQRCWESIVRCVRGSKELEIYCRSGLSVEFNPTVWIWGGVLILHLGLCTTSPSNLLRSKNRHTDPTSIEYMKRRRRGIEEWREVFGKTWLENRKVAEKPKSRRLVDARHQTFTISSPLLCWLDHTHTCLKIM